MSNPVSRRPLAWRHHAAILLLFVTLTLVLTYPQVRGLSTMIPYHSDPYFSIWRLAWVAHAIKTDPRALFEANIFYPAHHTLGYSDAALLQGAAAAPFFWAHVNSVLIYNGVLLASFALSGYAAFLLAWMLTGNAMGSMVAGIVYAFAPYRFCHYVHVELQAVFWIPLGLVMIHQIVAHGRARDGVSLGATVTAQLFSNVYMCFYSLIYFAVVMPALFVLTGARDVRRVLVATAAGAALTIVFAVPYMLAYQRTADDIGMRSLAEVRAYSASMKHYLSAPAMNRLYGWTAGNDPAWADEMNLFPGVLACLFALVGIATGRSRVRYAYLLGLAVSLELSRGASSRAYLWLYQHIDAFQALRSPARFAALVNLSLGVLAAFGVASLLERIARPAWKRLLGALFVAVLIAEYASSPQLSPVPSPSRIDTALARRPASVIVELPLLARGGFWGSFDSIYMFQGIGHFHKMLNGYSGHAPASFDAMRQAMAAFPDQRSMDFLRTMGVDYVAVRGGLYEPAQRAALFERMDNTAGLSLDSKWLDGPSGDEALYRIEPVTDLR